MDVLFAGSDQMSRTKFAAGALPKKAVKNCDYQGNCIFIVHIIRVNKEASNLIAIQFKVTFR